MRFYVIRNNEKGKQISKYMFSDTYPLMLEALNKLNKKITNSDNYWKVQTINC